MDAAGNEFMSDLFSTFSASMAEDAFTPPLIPEWIPFSNIIFPELQAAIVGVVRIKVNNNLRPALNNQFP
jgi:multiple sugar transport system substrate-binding protein